jgi:hypothetical protein
VSAGLPGLGLGGLFFIISALLAPLPELWRLIRGRSSVAAWRMIGRQLGQATLMIAAIDVSLRLVSLAISLGGLGKAPAAATGLVLPLATVGLTSALMVTVLCAAKLVELTVRLRDSQAQAMDRHAN